MRFDINLGDNSTRFTEGGVASVNNGVMVGAVTPFDMLGVDTSNVDIQGHSHPTKTLVNDGMAYTILATEPSSSDYQSFNNYKTNIISGNLERGSVTINSNGTVNQPKNTQGGVFYNSNGKEIMRINSKTINNILSNYSNGKIKK